jgi:replication-associated recombination protein RarA
MLPRKIIPIENPDKLFHEKWYNNRNLLNLPHPYRAVMLGPPNVGKTTVVKNLILRAHPQFEEIYVIHCDPSYTEEYDDLGDGCTILEEIPRQDEFEGKVKTLVVLDDLEFKFMDKDQKRNLDRLFGFVSTHKNISCCLCSQDPFNVPAIVRRCSNLWVLWKMTDMDAMATCARRTGMKSLTFKKIFQKLMTEPHDSLWIDLTTKSPMALRKNGYQAIHEMDKSADEDEEIDRQIKRSLIKKNLNIL